MLEEKHAGMFLARQSHKTRHGSSGSGFIWHDTSCEWTCTLLIKTNQVYRIIICLLKARPRVFTFITWGSEMSEQDPTQKIPLMTLNVQRTWSRTNFIYSFLRSQMLPFIWPHVCVRISTLSLTRLRFLGYYELCYVKLKNSGIRLDDRVASHPCFKNRNTNRVFWARGFICQITPHQQTPLLVSIQTSTIRIITILSIKSSTVVFSAGMYHVGSLSDTDAKVQTHRWFQL